MEVMSQQDQGRSEMLENRRACGRVPLRPPSRFPTPVLFPFAAANRAKTIPHAARLMNQLPHH